MTNGTKSKSVSLQHAPPAAAAPDNNTAPATTMGEAAPLMVMVLNTSISVRKWTSATTNDSSVAPA